jgi:hypothetical protein
MSGNQNLDKIYRRRFNEYECEQKNKIWKVLCPNFFQKFVPLDAAVLDIGAGYCEFINNILCAKKFAVDLMGRKRNQYTKEYKIEAVRLIVEESRPIF